MMVPWLRKSVLLGTLCLAFISGFGIFEFSNFSKACLQLGAAGRGSCWWKNWMKRTNCRLIRLSAH